MAEEIGRNFERIGSRIVNRLGTWASKLFTGLETTLKITGPIVSIANAFMVIDQFVKDISVVLLKLCLQWMAFSSHVVA